MATATLSAATRFLNRRLPVIVVCGATGTGKSKLALELAEKYGGEIISADSMQIYQGLDIITNKVTPDERQLVPHHLIDCASPLSRWTVVDFQRRSLPVIDRLLAEGKIPVIVGGTHYYIESLIWKVLIDDPQSSSSSDTDDVLVYDRDQLQRRQDNDVAAAVTTDDADDDVLLKTLAFTECGVSHVTSRKLHELLKKVDAAKADATHPNDRRKIIRSLQAWQQHGRPHSELLRRQRESDGGSSLGGPLRYPARTLIFWVQCQQDALDRRLDDRVDDMVRRGLLDELAHFHSEYNAQRIAECREADYTKGIFQSIGFKEFHEYLVLPPSEWDTDHGKRLLDAGVEALKVTTRRYARRQVKWIVKRFLQQPDRQVPPVYGLDATDVGEWNERVREPAYRVVDAFVTDAAAAAAAAAGDCTPSRCDLEPLAVASASSRDEQTSFHCPVCDRVTVGSRQWQQHLHGNRHRKMMKRAARLAKTPNDHQSKGAPLDAAPTSDSS